MSSQISYPRPDASFKHSTSQAIQPHYQTYNEGVNGPTIAFDHHTQDLTSRSSGLPVVKARESTLFSHWLLLKWLPGRRLRASSQNWVTVPQFERHILLPLSPVSWSELQILSLLQTETETTHCKVTFIIQIQNCRKPSRYALEVISRLMLRFL